MEDNVTQTQRISTALTYAAVAIMEAMVNDEGLDAAQGEQVLALIEDAETALIENMRHGSDLATVSRIIAGMEPGRFEKDPYKRLALIQEIALPYGLRAARATEGGADV